MSLARNSDIFKVGVDMAGVHDWSEQRWGRLNDSQRKLARESSPVAHVKTWRSPVLFIHGDDDRNVPFSETKLLVEKFDVMEVDYELLVFPDEVHSFLLYRNWVSAYEAMADFFERKLKPGM